MAAQKCACGAWLTKNHVCATKKADSVRANLGADKSVNNNKVPQLKATFRSHMMDGDIGTESHTGLHSRNEHVKDQKYVVETYAEHASKCFFAYATLAKTPKGSTFFPDDMNYDTIVAHVTTAWRYGLNYPLEANGWKKLYGVKWAGKTTINGKEIWIGGLEGTGEGNSKIATAFPLFEEALSVMTGK
jgi:hypothetical protein